MPLALQDEDEEDLDDLTIRTTDALLLAGTAEEDYSHLDMHIYEEPDDNIYVHHDIMLPTYPLCISWSDKGPIPLACNEVFARP